MVITGKYREVNELIEPRFDSEDTIEIVYGLWVS